MKPAKIIQNPQEPENTTANAANISRLLSSEDLQVLRAPFSKDRLGVKVQSLNKDRTRAMLVQYLQHTDVQDRLEEVDPAWSIEVLREDIQAETVYVRCRMIVKNVSRENVGEGGDPKSAYSDALKRCAMLFGVGRYLYDASTAWTAYNESQDRYRQWTVDDYDSAVGKVQERPQSREELAKQEQENGPTVGIPPLKKVGAKTKTITPNKTEQTEATHSASAVEARGLTTQNSRRAREELNRVLLQLYRPFLAQFPQTQFATLLNGRYKVGETRLMSVDQLEDLVQFMEQKLRSVA